MLQFKIRDLLASPFGLLALLFTFITITIGGKWTVKEFVDLAPKKVNKL